MVTLRSTGVLPQVGRRQRRPSHPYYLYTRPFQIHPFHIAPVLPGETLKEMRLQSRVVSDPILNPLSGWWLEHYFFYVKLRDMDPRDDYTQMMLQATIDLTAYDQAAVDATSRLYYQAAGGQSYAYFALKRVVEEWFRDGPEAGGFILPAYVENGSGFPLAKINGEAWTNSLMPLSQLQTGVDVKVADLGSNTTLSGDDDLYVSEIDQAMRQYQFLRENGLVQMDYEDYLATFGIKAAQAVDDHRPELIRYMREWTYPTNVVEPTTGAAKSAVSWAITEQANKSRFFKEPGFIFGVTVTRPKVFLRKQLGSMTGFMDNAFAWLPAIMSNDPATSLRPFTSGTGPVPSLAVDSVADMRDLLLYGEQFINIDVTNAEMNGVSLPKSTADNTRYPTNADIDAFFVNVDGGTSGVTKYRVRHDGVVNLHILGSQQDTSPRGGNVNLA